MDRQVLLSLILKNCRLRVRLKLSQAYRSLLLRGVLVLISPQVTLRKNRPIITRIRTLTRLILLRKRPLKVKRNVKLPLAR